MKLLLNTHQLLKIVVSRDGLEPSTHSLKGIALPTELTAQRGFL